MKDNFGYCFLYQQWTAITGNEQRHNYYSIQLNNNYNNNSHVIINY